MYEKLFIDEKSGISIIVIKNKNESDEQFYGRGYFMLKYKKHYDIDMDELIKISHIWKNIKYLHCEYPSELMIKIKNVQ